MPDKPSVVTETVDLAANAPEAISNILEYAGKISHGVGYTDAYITVFSVGLLFAVIPNGNALVQGLMQGYSAARSKTEEMQR